MIKRYAIFWMSSDAGHWTIDELMSKHDSLKEAEEYLNKQDGVGKAMFTILPVYESS